MYEFSFPMPLTIDGVDKIVSINKEVKKSKVTCLYFGLPCTDEDCTGFEQIRNGMLKKTNFDYWKDIFVYIKEKGFDFVYLLNSPRHIDGADKNLNKKLKKLDNLIKRLSDIGFNKYRITNLKLMSYLHDNYSDIDLLSSTSLEYTTLKQYENLIENHPYLKQIVFSHDITKNFRLLKNIREKYPDMDFEIMANEGCMGGCPYRNIHPAEIGPLSQTDKKCDKNFENSFSFSMCSNIMNKNPWLFICKANNIYPWEIEEYGKIGYYKFKLVGRDRQFSTTKGFYEGLLIYLKGIDSPKLIENFRLNRLIHRVTFAPLPYIKHIKPYLPDIRHFVKNGHLCSSICSVECTYCHKCAEKILKKLGI